MSEHEPEPGQRYEDWLAEGYGPSIADIMAALKAEIASLAAERNAVRALLKRVLDSHRRPWVYGMSVTITEPPSVYAAWRADIERGGGQ